MYSLYKRNVIADSLDELLTEKLIQRETFKTGMGGRDQYKYLLNIANIKAKLATVICNSSPIEEPGKITDQQGKITVDTSRGTVNSNSSHAQGTVKNHNGIECTTNPSLSNIETKESTPSLPSALIPLENLSEQERAFWDLWCSRPFNKVAPKLNQTAYKHIQALAPHVKTEEQINSLIDYSRQKLEKQGKGKVVYLGNMSGDLNDWLQTPASQPKPPEKEKPLDAGKLTREERIAYIMATPYNLPHDDQRRNNLQRCLAYLSEDDRAEVVKRRSEQCPPDLDSVTVLWTRQPDHKGDPVSNYKLYEDIPLKEAIAYFYEGWDYLLPYQVREIKLKQKLAQKVTA